MRSCEYLRLVSGTSVLLWLMACTPAAPTRPENLPAVPSASPPHRHISLSPVGATHIVAVHVVPIQTSRAGHTRIRDKLDAHPRPDLHALTGVDRRAERDDSAHTLMAGDDGLDGPVCPVAQGERDVGMADTAVFEVDEALPGLEGVGLGGGDGAERGVVALLSARLLGRGWLWGRGGKGEGGDGGGRRRGGGV